LLNAVVGGRGLEPWTSYSNDAIAPDATHESKVLRDSSTNSEAFPMKRSSSDPSST